MSRHWDVAWMRTCHKPLLRLLFVLLSVGAVSLMVAPAHVLQQLVREVDWIGGVAKFFRYAAPATQVDHVIAFAAVGFVAHIGWRDWRAWHVALGLYVMAGLTEAAQVWMPGRISSVWHVLLDVAAGLAGFAMAWLVTYAWGNESFAGTEQQTSTR